MDPSKVLDQVYHKVEHVLQYMLRELWGNQTRRASCCFKMVCEASFRVTVRPTKTLKVAVRVEFGWHDKSVEEV